MQPFYYKLLIPFNCIREGFILVISGDLFHLIFKKYAVRILLCCILKERVTYEG